MGLGSATEVSLKEARQSAEQWRAFARQGKDPIKEREKERREAERDLHCLADIALDAFESRKAELKDDGKAGRWFSPLELHVLPKLGKVPVPQQHLQRYLVRATTYSYQDRVATAVDRGRSRRFPQHTSPWRNSAVIIFKHKVQLSIGVDPKKLAAIGLCKAHDVIFPLSEGGDAANDVLISQLKKAIKHEHKQRKKCEVALKKGSGAFKKAAKTYLNDKRCLLVALFNDNNRRPLEDRRSIQELIALASAYDILKDLNEPARVWQQPKASGNGMRVICSFGPVARAAQQMVTKLLRLTYQPQDFQFAKLTFAEKVQHAISAIKEKGYAHVREIDIRDFFPSFEKEALLKSLPLPVEATRHIVLARAQAGVHIPLTLSMVISHPLPAYHRAVRPRQPWPIGV